MDEGDASAQDALRQPGQIAPLLAQQRREAVPTRILAAACRSVLSSKRCVYREAHCTFHWAFLFKRMCM